MRKLQPSACCTMPNTRAASFCPSAIRPLPAPHCDLPARQLIKRSSLDHPVYPFRTNTYASQTVPQFAEFSIHPLPVIPNLAWVYIRSRPMREMHLL